MATITTPVIFTSEMLEIHTCKKCSGIYALNQQFVNECRRMGNFQRMWHCPYCGIKWGYGDSEEDRLKKQIAEKDRQLKVKQESIDYAWEEQRKTQTQRDHARKQRDGMKGQLVLTKKRVANGVCPCCSRTFNDLARHMECKHPGYGATPPTPKPSEESA